jgi:nucleoside-diphosphate-sugar epimerase
LGGSSPNSQTVQSLGEFGTESLDQIINCIGAADPREVRRLGARFMRLTETFDNRVLDYLEDEPAAQYVFLSSGAAYGLAQTGPVSSSTPATFAINEIDSRSCYGLAKLNAEAKHRAMKARRIVDLRLFGFVSQNLNPNGDYLLSQAVRAILQRKPLDTKPTDIVRDYAHPQDLAQLIGLCRSQGSLNASFDVFSKEPIAKFALLDALSSRFGLRWRIGDGAKSDAAEKPQYFSRDRRAEEIGYRPRFSALEAVLDQVGGFLEQAGHGQ